MKAYRTLLAASATAVLLQACAYNRPDEVTQQMGRTEAVLQQAERSGVQEKSLPELQAAKDKYAEAKRAYDKDTKDGDRDAMRLAKQAEVDAQYATAKAQAQRQEEAAREVQSGTEALREEASRNASSPVAQN